MHSKSWLPAVLVEDWKNGGFGLYVHWPFCQSKCPYCDFNSHVSASIDQARWKSAYLSEIARVADETNGRVLHSIYFGGGTPSLMQPDVVAAIIGEASNQWAFANNIEITLEANPTSVEAQKFNAFRDGGVNRVSLGVQALNDKDLRALGRLHSAKDALAALSTAQNIFDRVSFDLIYARQNQSLSDWESELKKALSLGADHMSLYQLTVEQGTAFGDRYNKGSLHGLPSEDLGADMFFLTQDLCANAGRPAYETSNHAAVGQESIHNQIYWRCGDYIGIGPGAHGRVTLSEKRFATETYLAPGQWLKSVEDSASGESERTQLDREDQDSELLLMGLRLYEGVDTKRSSDRYLINKIKYLLESDLVHVENDLLRLTRSGRPLLNSILKQLI